MVNLTLRETGATPKGSPLSNAEIDQNFINLKEAVEAVPTDIGAFALPNLGPGVIEMNNYADAFRHFTTGSIIAGGDVTDHGNGTFSFAACDLVIRESAAEDAPLHIFHVAAAGPLTPIDNDVNYYFIDFNSGAPVWASGTSVTDYNGLNKMQGWTVARRGTRLQFIDARAQSVDGNRKTRRLLLETSGTSQNGYWHARGGSTIAGAGLSITVTSGKFFYGLAPLSHAAFDTSVAGVANLNVFDYYSNRANWAYTTDSKTINNTQYDNAGTLTTMNNGRYRTDWAYLVLCGVNPRLVVIMGNAQYASLAEAQAAPMPSSLPAWMDGASVLLGQIVVLKSATTLTVQSAFTTGFQGAATSTHNALGSMQGGAAGEYYHLTLAQHANLPAAITAAGAALLDDADVAAQRTTLGLGTAAPLNVADTGNAAVDEVVKGNDSRLTDARPASDVSAWAKEATKPSYTKSEVGLGNVDNTSDLDKPISTAVQTALNEKSDTSHVHTLDFVVNAQGLADPQADRILFWDDSANAHKYLEPDTTLAITGTQLGVRAATTSQAGTMSAADKIKLDGVATGANNYSHPASGVAAGTYKSVTVDTAGHVTGGTNPTTLSGYGITDAAPSTHVGATGTAHGNATTSVAGFMSETDKTKLDGVAAGAQVNVATNIAEGTRTTTTVPITSSTGTGASLSAATTSLAGVMTSTDKTKLDGIEAGANNYTHPANHPASIITQDASNRFVTDAEKSAWNSKQDVLVSGTNIKTVNGQSLLGGGDLELITQSQYVADMGDLTSALITINGV